MLGQLLAQLLFPGGQVLLPHFAGGSFLLQTVNLLQKGPQLGTLLLQLG